MEGQGGAGRSGVVEEYSVVDGQRSFGMVAAWRVMHYRLPREPFPIFVV